MTPSLAWCRFVLVASTSLIFALGVVMIYNTTSAEVLELHLAHGTHQALIKQLLYAVCGILLAGGMWLLGYRNLLALSPKLLLAGTILLLLVLIPGVGVSANGARRWIGLGGLTIQPSEFVRQVIPLYLIYRVLRIDPKGTISYQQFLRIVGILFIPLLLIAAEPNNGTVAIVCIVTAVTLFLLHVPERFWAAPMVAVLLVAGVVAYNMPYVSGRIKVYLNPELDLLGRGHQPHQAKIAAGSGQLFGKGPGKSIQKLSYLPEAQNDYIAAIFAEEFGFAGVVALIGLYLATLCAGFHIAYWAPDSSGCYLATALLFLIGFQAFLNLGVVSGLLPSTGLNLPFFSQGGSSLVANTGALGILLDIGRDRRRALCQNES